MVNSITDRFLANSLRFLSHNRMQRARYPLNGELNSRPIAIHDIGGGVQQ
jgi:hypothetical protein